MTLLLHPRLLLLLLAVVLAGPATAQTADDLYRLGQREPAIGARMTAMGGAAGAGLGDWTAAFANPAGLAYLRSRQAIAAAHAFTRETDGTRGRRSSGEAEAATLSALGFAAPLPVARGALAFGGGYQETATYARVVSDGRFPSLQEEGWQGEASLAGAVALTPRLMGGLSVNAPVGRYRREGADPNAPRDAAPWFDAELAGVNVRGGLSLALDYGVRLGLTVETPTYLRVEQVGRVWTDDVVPPRDVALVTPWRVALGFLAGSETLLVTADVEVVDWSQARFDTDGDADLVRENAFAEALFRTVLNSRVGGEARLGAVALRVGAAFQPDPRFDGPVPEAVRQQYALGVGVQLHPQARLDLAFTHTRDEDAFVPLDGVVGRRNALQVGLDLRF